METTLRRIGNSLGVVLPAGVVKHLGLRSGDKLVIATAPSQVVLSPERDEHHITEEQIEIGKRFADKYATAMSRLAR